MTDIKVKIVQTNNGWIMQVAGSLKKNGVYVYKATEEHQLAADLAEVMVGYKVNVTRR